MSSSSESDFENNSFETDESDEFPSENELSDNLREIFSKRLFLSDFLSVQVKSRSMLHNGSVGLSSE